MRLFLFFIGILLFNLIILCSLLLFKLFEYSNETSVKSEYAKIETSVKSEKGNTPTMSPSSSENIINNNYTSPDHVISLTNWKLTLPTGKEESPTEIKQPILSDFQSNPWFVVLPNFSGLRFRAPVNGVTTKGSDYPRSELREMTNNGTENASWSNTSGVHSMIIDQAITATPKKKKHVVAGQIHDASDDFIVIRLEEENLYINVDGDNKYILDSNYTLGKRFKVRFVASNGKTKIYYNSSSSPVFTLNKENSGAYFKAGVYTQSNCEKENSEDCNDENFGEVVIYSFSVTHQ